MTVTMHDNTVNMQENQGNTQSKPEPFPETEPFVPGNQPEQTQAPGDHSTTKTEQPRDDIVMAEAGEDPPSSLTADPTSSVAPAQASETPAQPSTTQPDQPSSTVPVQQASNMPQRTATPVNATPDVAPTIPARAAVHGAPARAYLNQKVTGVLMEGMKRLAKEQPEDPLRVLGEYLLKRSREVEGT